MDRETTERPEELDCIVTVADGSWMTCDMIPEESEEG
jgi:hypothetical protein